MVWTRWVDSSSFKGNEYFLRKCRDQICAFRGVLTLLRREKPQIVHQLSKMYRLFTATCRKEKEKLPTTGAYLAEHPKCQQWERTYSSLATPAFEFIYEAIILSQLPRPSYCRCLSNNLQYFNLYHRTDLGITMDCNIFIKLPIKKLLLRSYQASQQEDSKDLHTYS